MQIVIDIDDRVYGLLKYFETGLGLDDKKDDNDDVKTALMRAVLHGTLLPKHHENFITCKDCKYYKRIELNSCDEVIATCKKHTDRNYHYISPDFYCADGERSEE